MSKYEIEITTQYKNVTNEAVYIPRYGLDFQPLINWGNSRSPNWWNSYNRVKHERNSYYSEANLQNTLNALGALHILDYYYSTIFRKEKPKLSNKGVMEKLQPESTLLRLEDKYYPDVLDDVVLKSQIFS